MLNYQSKGIPEQYEPLLNEIKQKQAKLFWQINKENDRKESATNILREYFAEQNISFENWSTDEIVERLYNDIFEKSVLTAPLHDIWVDSIHIHSWDNITVDFLNGKSIQIDGFCSKLQAVDVIYNLLNELYISTAISAVTTKEKELQITAVFEPIVTNQIGVCCIIHKCKNRIFTTQDYIANDFATKKELDFLKTALQYNTSILIAGNGLSGKTSFINYLLSSLSDKNIINIETERELDAGTSLLLSDKDNLAKYAMGLNPDIITFNTENIEAVDTSLDGYTTIATAVTNNPLMAILRTARSYQKQKEIDYQTALELTCSAFPLIVTIKRYGDKKRRIRSICHCTENAGHIDILKLWEYQINGSHKQLNNVPDDLLNKMKSSGILFDELALFKKQEDENDVISESNRSTGG